MPFLRGENSGKVLREIDDCGIRSAEFGIKENVKLVLSPDKAKDHFPQFRTPNSPLRIHPEKCSQQFTILCSRPIYRAILKTADESADYRKIRMCKMVGQDQLHFPGS